MTDNKNQELIVWMLARTQSLLQNTSHQSKQRVEELMEMAKKLLPKDEAEQLISSMKKMWNGSPVEDVHQEMKKSALARLKEELNDWDVTIKSETAPGPMMLGRNAVLPGNSQWFVQATKVSKGELPTVGIHSMEMELAAQNHSLNDAIEAVLKQHKQLKDIGLD